MTPRDKAVCMLLALSLVLFIGLLGVWLWHEATLLIIGLCALALMAAC